MSTKMITTTIEACMISATGSILAQYVTAFRNGAPLITDWTPVFQFVLFTALNTPPNMLWQYFLESSFPANYTAPSKSAVDAASKSNEAELDREEKTHEITESHLSIRNLIIKILLDQTVSASVNTILFSLAFAGFNGTGLEAAWGKATEEFWPLMIAGWKLWPLVSLVNFAIVKSVEGRNLVGSLAGLVWVVYLSLTRG